ncbi:velvet factor-domain-containing protein [Spinellus fusiger]|nr:velvet factor-domain-containing protein [Spinellus fusiger]
MTLLSPRHQSHFSDRAESDSIKYKLVVRQQPHKARLCSFKEKVDRRPLDPPPIIQLVVADGAEDIYYTNPHTFLYATLATSESQKDLHFVNGTRTTAGSMVQSLHKLKDIDDKEGGFFVFADISVRLEGFFKLRFTMFEIEGENVHRICSVLSDTFQVYSPKTFPGMSESTFLTRSFSDQGVRIRIRKETRVPPVITKRRRTIDKSCDSDDSNEKSGDSGSVSSAVSSNTLHQDVETPGSHSHGRSVWPSLSQASYSGPPLPSPAEMLLTKEANSRMSMQSLLLTDSLSPSYSYHSLKDLPSSPELSMEYKANIMLLFIFNLPIHVKHPMESAGMQTLFLDHSFYYRNDDHRYHHYPS